MFSRDTKRRVTNISTTSLVKNVSLIQFPHSLKTVKIILITLRNSLTDQLN